jgi:hypothetical protein
LRSARLSHGKKPEDNVQPNDERLKRITKSGGTIQERERPIPSKRRKLKLTSFCLFRVAPIPNFLRGVDFFDAFFAFPDLFHDL